MALVFHHHFNVCSPRRRDSWKNGSPEDWKRGLELTDDPVLRPDTKMGTAAT